MRCSAASRRRWSRFISPAAFFYWRTRCGAEFKTKILEAFDHGVPTIGTASAFEGFEGEYPWRVDEHRLRQLVGDPVALRETYQKAVSVGSEICSRQFSRRRYALALSDYVHKQISATEHPSVGAASRQKLAASLG